MSNEESDVKYGTDGEENEEDCIVRIRGMPWSSTEKDVLKFFGGENRLFLVCFS
jgi:RNA recognition motif-containing protein